VTAEPPLWAAARGIAARYGGIFHVSARDEVLRADYAHPPTGVTMPCHTAYDEATMIAKLDAAVAVMSLRRQAAFALGGAAR
jgi:hypothetical protein